MPRVAIKKKEYMVTDLSKWIVGKMYELDLTQNDLAEMIGITQPAFCQRLKKGMFSYLELLILLKRLSATDDEILKMMKV